MSLGDIKRDLYKKEKDYQPPAKEEAPFDPRYSKNGEKFSEEEKWGEGPSKWSWQRNKGIFIGGIFLGLILIFVLLVSGYYFFWQVSFDNGNVKISIDAPEESDSGDFIDYTIKINNENFSKIENVSLKLSYPGNFDPGENEGFEPGQNNSSVLSIGEIPGHSEKQIEFQGRIYSPKGSLSYLKAELFYQPNNLSTQYSTENVKSISIISSPVSLNVVSPGNAASGNVVNYLVRYKNDSAERFSDMFLRAQYPDGFSFSESNPEPSQEKNIWNLGQINPQGSGEISITGKLEGNDGEIKKIKFVLGKMEGVEFIPYDEEEASVKIIGSPISIWQTVNDQENLAAFPGEHLEFKIHFRNNGDVGLNNLILTEKLEGKALDFSELKLDSGTYNSNSNTITWKVADTDILKNLAPGEEKTISFDVKVESPLPVSEKEDKNFIISSLAKVDSPDIPTPIDMNKVISSNSIDIKINTQLKIDVSGYYSDDVISNSGPIPPRVGEKTSYAIHWKLSNYSNDIGNPKIEADLPSNIFVSDKFFPDNENFYYDSRINKIFWQPGRIDAGTGILNNPRELVFQVEINPSVDQQGRQAELIKETKFTALDLFTSREVSATASAKTTILKEDNLLSEQGRIAEE